MKCAWKEHIKIRTKIRYVFHVKRENFQVNEAVLYAMIVTVIPNHFRYKVVKYVNVMQDIFKTILI